MGRAADLAHLVARLADVLLSRRLTPLEQAEVAQYLMSPSEQMMFWGQPRADQRHALEAARSVASRLPERLDLIRAALLHDVGKRHARLGWFGRVWAVLRSGIGTVTTSRMAGYLEHGRLGSEELADARAEPLVVAYARHHHGERPDTISPGDWAVLLEADRAVLPGLGSRRPGSKTAPGAPPHLRWRPRGGRGAR